VAAVRPRRRALTVIAVACAVLVWAGSVGAADGAPVFEYGSELLLTDVSAAQLVGYGTVGQHALELQLATVSANVRVLVVAPDGAVVPFLGTFTDGRLVLTLGEGAALDVADHLARDDRDLVFVLPNGRRVLVPVEGRERTAEASPSRAPDLEGPAPAPTPPSPGGEGSDDDSDDDWDDDSDDDWGDDWEDDDSGDDWEDDDDDDE
jgi:hypothetical protein